MLVVRLMGQEAGEELGYSEEKIIDNFSNYSAWHYRTVMLPKVRCRCRCRCRCRLLAACRLPLPLTLAPML